MATSATKTIPQRHDYGRRIAGEIRGRIEASNFVIRPRAGNGGAELIEEPSRTQSSSNDTRGRDDRDSRTLSEPEEPELSQTNTERVRFGPRQLEANIRQIPTQPRALILRNRDRDEIAERSRVRHSSSPLTNC
jgi:hypothetical protein